MGYDQYLNYDVTFSCSIDELKEHMLNVWKELHKGEMEPREEYKEWWLNEVERAFNAEDNEYGAENDGLDVFLDGLAKYAKGTVWYTGDDSDDFSMMVYPGDGTIQTKQGWKAYGPIYDLFMEEYGASMPEALKKELAELKTIKDTLATIE